MKSTSKDQHEAITPPRTPTAATTEAHRILAKLQEINGQLLHFPSLAPGDQVNSLLTDLVSFCIQPCNPECLAQLSSMSAFTKTCKSLRSLCARAEGELEAYWAQRIIEGSGGVSQYSLGANGHAVLCKSSQVTNTDSLYDFPYCRNYFLLSKLELSTLSIFLHDTPRHVVFIGSGPLPLTSFCISLHYRDINVHNVDRDASALKLGQDFCRSQQIDMTFACEDVSETQVSFSKQNSNAMDEVVTDWMSFDVVFLAALVGEDTPSKLAILANIAARVKPGTLVVARSAKGLRAVLYPVSHYMNMLRI